MRNRYRWSIGLVLALATSGAWAGGGRIDFYGAVAEPTCPTAGLSNESVLHARGLAPQRLGCGRSLAGTTYSRKVVDLTMANRKHDRLLDYFASYVPVAAGGDVTTKVVIQTYD
jgi:hypothetical protein